MRSRVLLGVAEDFRDPHRVSGAGGPWLFCDPTLLSHGNSRFQSARGSRLRGRRGPRRAGFVFFFFAMGDSGLRTDGAAWPGSWRRSRPPGAGQVVSLLRVCAIPGVARAWGETKPRIPRPPLEGLLLPNPRNLCGPAWQRRLPGSRGPAALAGSLAATVPVVPVPRLPKFSQGSEDSGAFSATVCLFLLPFSGLWTEVTVTPKSTMGEWKRLEVKIWDILAQNFQRCVCVCLHGVRDARPWTNTVICWPYLRTATTLWEWASRRF